ncbi:sugar ABC transporter substrate-binding protein [Vagococcus sp. BWB3-3]|uniref:Sugar ABC transporter substrate-binding protein n=1 Tax=Vagococcus allomyrinae TaxID=2794353 RepID=A0A940P8K4_9ENTE|nr:sugar ABC transporter substrate-binding protein [Vagococcus allomyrinae]MBP1039528.1 sugar ABC transporter substrate-binding protein [Vagococcus allomyrinae]
MKLNKKWLLGLISVLVAVMLVGCGSGGEKGKEASEFPESTPEKLKKDIKIMVIRKIGGDDHTAQYLAGAKSEGEALGFTVDTYSANGDTAKFHDAIKQAGDKKYDGVIISHGDDAATAQGVKELVDKGIPVVTFDSVADIADIEGVTMTSQNDEELANLALQELHKRLGDEAKFAYLWVDGLVPMVKRNKIYTAFLADNPGYKELDRYGVVAADTTVQTQNAVGAMLTKYGKGKIDGIFATWDAFGMGAHRALEEANRNDVTLVSIDVSNADLQAMQAENSSWVATAACDPKLIGEVNLRILAMKIAEEETPAEFTIKPTLITQEQLKAHGSDVTMENLADVVDGWGKSTDFVEDWMKDLKDVNKK